MTSHWLPSWFIGLGLIGVTITLHAIGLVQIMIVLNVIRRRSLRDRLTLVRRSWLVTALIGATGAALMVLHAIQAGLWALAYIVVGALDTYRDAILYSIDSMTTRGAAGVKLAEDWAMMGALEAAAGMLLFGISTAFLFGVMSHIWVLLTRGHQGR